MACLITPAVTAIITTNLRKKIPAKYHLEWLNAMLWGGVIMLTVDHIINGEIIFFPPFLTAMRSPTDIPAVLKEITITGGAMTIAIILAWVAMVLIANRIEEKSKEKTQTVIM